MCTFSFAIIQEKYYKSEGNGYCKHCAALVYQLCGYIQLDLKCVPDNKIYTNTLQQ